jgi:hypothetical protein
MGLFDPCLLGMSDSQLEGLLGLDRADVLQEPSASICRVCSVASCASSAGVAPAQRRSSSARRQRQGA